MGEALRKDGTPTSVPSPARGYSWEPFEKGNLAAVRHGANSERLVSAKAQAVRSMLVEKYPYLADDVFTEALERYARVEARAWMLHDYVMDKAEREGVEKVPSTLWTEATRADALAQKCASDCGLDPTGHARIARDLGFARNLQAEMGAKRLEALAESGRELREGTGR